MDLIEIKTMNGFSFKIEILYLSIVHRTFMKGEFDEKWQGDDIDASEGLYCGGLAQTISIVQS